MICSWCKDREAIGTTEREGKPLPVCRMCSSGKSMKKYKLTLYKPERAVARSTDPNTSWMAAKKVDVPTHIELVQMIALELKDQEDRWPMTHHDMYEEFKKRGHSGTPQSIRSRMSELEKQGFFVKVDEAGISEYGNAAGRWDLNPDL